MIPAGTYDKPKHARTQYDALTEQRPYPAHVCPGQHCIGRTGLGREVSKRISHRHTDAAVHTLTPTQAEAADRTWTR